MTHKWREHHFVRKDQGNASLDVYLIKERSCGDKCCLVMIIQEWAKGAKTLETSQAAWQHPNSFSDLADCIFYHKIPFAYLEKLTFEETKSQMKISTVSSEEMISKNKSLQLAAMLCCTKLNLNKYCITHFSSKVMESLITQIMCHCSVNTPLLQHQQSDCLRW